MLYWLATLSPDGAGGVFNLFRYITCLLYTSDAADE